MQTQGTYYFEKAGDNKTEGFKDRRKDGSKANSMFPRFSSNLVIIKEMRHCLTILTSKYFIVYGQKYKVQVCIYLIRSSGTLLRPNLSRLCESFCFATKIENEYDHEIPPLLTTDKVREKARSEIDTIKYHI